MLFMLVVAPVGRVWYRFYDTAGVAPAVLNVTDMPEAARAGARQFALHSGVVASALVSEHAIVKSTVREYFCVAPLVRDDDEALRLFDYAHSLMPVKPDVDGGDEEGGGAGTLQQQGPAAAAAEVKVVSPWPVNVSAWVAYAGSVACIEPIHEKCTTGVFATEYCAPSVAIPDLTRKFTETRIYQSWSSDQTLPEGVSVHTAAKMVDTTAMFEQAVQNSALPSLDGAPVIWWGVDLEGYTQCRLDNALSVLGYWWIGAVVVAACTLYLPQLAGLLAIGFVVIVWAGAEYLYDDEHCLLRFLPEAHLAVAEASVSAVT